MSDTLKRAVSDLAAALVAWRRDFHRHPELGFEEHRTAGVVAEHLRDLGLDTVRTGVGRTGVVGVLRAARAQSPALLLRADMDALPVREEPGRPYGSEVPGTMHACGHDGHMAMLLGAATVLAGYRERLTRDVVFCFQPAEEGQGGAQAVLREGILEEYAVGEAFGVHLWSLFPSGTIHVGEGPVMAAQDEFVATLLGRGGHGAAPHLCVDPVLAAAQALVALQSVVSRSVDPLQAAVVSVGSLHGGTAPNVIPNTASMHGTLRSFSASTRELLRQRVREVMEGCATASGCALRFDIKPGFPAVVNAAASVVKVRSAASAVVGPAGVRVLTPMAASEDFAYFLEAVPGAFVFVGAGNEARGITAPHHSAAFDIDESALPTGTELLVRLALD